MDWESGRRSSNIDDRRGRGGRPVAMGLGTLVVIGIVSVLLGADPVQVLTALTSQGLEQPGPARTSRRTSARDDRQADFTSAVLATTEDAWGQIFKQRGERYVEPRLTLFEDEVQTACGGADSAVGPFYCPADRHVYLDLSFFDELHTRFAASGDFAQAYVIAHEVGHHVQTLLGTERRLRAQERGLSQVQKNALSVRLELQADCYAGIWAKEGQRQRHFLQAGDIESALRAAAAIGDDRLQQRARGRVMPETFTHGTSAQRVKWFKTGFEQGTLEACDTFDATP